MASSSKALSSAEYTVMERMYHRGGSWTAGDLPLWENRHWTLHLLNVLAVRGLVDEVERDTRYDLGRKGLSYFR